MKENKVIRALFMLTQLGISMMVPIALCMWIAVFLRNKTGSNLWIFLFLVLGMGAAFRNVYYLLKPFFAGDKAREDKELSYIEALKKEGQRNAQYRERGEGNDRAGE